jgi:3'-phosphoadenosine 5'-phosphosulfate sulfotransferase (PAPS reductase)/FAD synthetase
MHSLVNEAVDLLEKADDMGKCGMLFTGGKDSMIMLHLWREHIGGQPPLLVVDTYNQFDEIYDFRKEIAEEWNLVLDVRSNEEFLEEVIWNDDDERGFAWDGPKTEECCGALKIDVMGDFISDGYDPLIVGRRGADVNGELSTTEEKREPVPHDRVHPLHNWSDTHVKAFIKKHNIPLPDLYDQGYEHTDCADCVAQGEEGDDWSGVSQEKKEQLNQLRDMGYM